MSPLVNPQALFKVRIPCPRRDRLWPPAGWGLDEACRLPSFAEVVGVPDVLVNGGGANGGLVEALIALVTKNTRQASLSS